MSFDSTLFSAMLGSLVGGSATVATAWITQKTVSRRELVQADIDKREALYGQFISECAKLLMDSFTHTLEKPETLLPLLALINRIRLAASAAVLVEAERLFRRITEQYFSRNLTVEEMRELALATEADPLRQFGEACRAELKAVSAQA
jgi:hypothetical protein